MADVDEPPSAAANKPKTKERSKRKRILGWFKQPKSATASNQDLTSVSSNPSQGGNRTLNQDDTAPFQSTGSSSSVPDLLGPALGQGRRGKTSHTSSLTAQATPTDLQTQVSDWKATAKEGLGVGLRFAQTLLKKMPDCVDANPVKVAFSIVRTIIEIKDAVGDNKDELARCLEETKNRLLAVERMVVNGLPEAAEEAMEKLKRILGEEMEKLKDLTNKSLAARTFDYEEYKKMIQQIFQRVTEATTSFQVEMAVSIQSTASQIHDDIKKAALKFLCPSQKADHKTFLEEQALKREECTAGTRVKILEDITNWANDSSPKSPRVFWLTGQAGSGKTTIAYTIAKLFEKSCNATDQQTVLGGNFLCSRQFEETRERTRIIPTIAYQLSRKCKSYADALHVADNFDAVNHAVSVQLKGLLVGPWQQTEAARSPQSPYLIVIDALDEIKGDGGSAFLRDLFTAIEEYDLRGFKFLVTSRSDPEVVRLFESFASKADRWLQHVPIEEALLDIGTYLDEKLPMLASSPGLAELGRRSRGLFIYAATAVKYLNPHRSIRIREQTEMLDDLLSNSYESASASDATSLIDELYQQIMRDTFSTYRGKFLARRLSILYTFLCTAERTSTSIVAALVMEGDDDATRAVAEDLHAVLYIQDNRVFWYHASFPDFIFNPARSNFRLGEDYFTFSCDEPAHHNLLGEACFCVMKSGLRFNMGDIMSSFLFDSDNTDVLTEKVNTNISAVLRYSSRHWTHHLPSPQSTNTDKLRHCISDFLQIHVLFWIEAMNLIGSHGRCTPMLQCARQWVLKCGNSHSDLARDIGEAANFATYFAGSPAAESTPHLYISALATWLQDSNLCRNWKKQFARIPVFTHTKGKIDLPLMTISAGSQISAVGFSSDDTQIVSGSEDGFVRVWDASTGAELNVLIGHTDRVNSVVFSSDSTRIVSGSDDHSVRVWETSTSAELIVLEGHSSLVTSVAFSSDGAQIVSGSYDKSVRVWDVSTGAVLHVLMRHTDNVNSVAFSGDGMQIVSGSDDHSVRVWDVLTGLELKVLEGHTDWVHSVAFSNDSTQIVSGSDDHSVRVWDVSAGMELKELEGHTNNVTSVAFSRNGMWIVSGSYDQSVRVWDVSKGTELNVLRGHTGEVTSVAFSNDGTRIASGSLDGSVRVWDVSAAGAENILKGHTDDITSVVFSSDGTQIVSGSADRSVRVWDASNGGELKILKGHTEGVTSVALSSDRVRIVSGSRDQSVRVWDASTGTELKMLKGHTERVTSVALSRDSMRIVSGSNDESVRMWDASTGAELRMLKGHTYFATSVALSSDGMRIVSGSADHSVRVWDGSTGAELKVLKGHTDWVRSVAFSNDSVRIVSGSDDRSVRVWDVSTGVELKMLEGHTHWVLSVAFSNDGTQIVSGSRDRSVRVWDVSTGAEQNVLRGHRNYVNSVAFSSDGTQIVSGSFDQSVRVWDVSNGPEHLVWSLTETNWLISCKGEDRLMWVPPEAQLKELSNILIISRHGFGSVDFTQARIGDEWVGCYTP